MIENKINEIVLKHTEQIKETNSLWESATTLRANALKKQEQSAKMIQKILSEITESLQTIGLSVSDINFKIDATAISGIIIVFTDGSGVMQKIEVKI